MTVRFFGLVLACPWAIEIFHVNMETGAPGEPPPSASERAARALLPAAEQRAALDIMFTWWAATADALNAERQELAGAALAAPSSLEAQQASVTGLERVQSRYLLIITAMAAVGAGSMLTPEQLADVYLTSWPYMASMPGICAAALRLYPAPP